MSFAKLDDQQEAKVEYKKNPWLSFKGDNGKYDRNHSPYRLRSLDSYRQLMNQVALTHWDGDLKKKVACGRRVWKTPQGELKLTKADNCWYCVQDKATKDEFAALKAANDPSVAEMKYPRRPWQLDVCIVARVAVLNKDKSQTFALAALPAKDMVFGTGKGVYKLLTEFEEAARSDEENPTDLRDYWWDFGPKTFNNVPGKNGMVTDKQKETTPDGLMDDESGEEFNVEVAQPFDYNEAMKLRSELKQIDGKAKPYPSQNQGQQEKNVEIDHGDLDNQDYDDNIPPF